MKKKKNKARCTKQVVEESNGTIILRITEWPRGIIGYVFKRSNTVIPIDSLEIFAQTEPIKFLELAYRFFADSAYSDLLRTPDHSENWHRFCNRILNIAHSRGITFGGMLG